MPLSTKIPDPSNPWSVLDNSEQLRFLFTKYPSLPAQIKQIHVATLQPPRQVGKPSRKDDRWNRDIGMRKGIEALRKARAAEGEAGEGLREYTELIRHLLNGGQDGRSEVSTAFQQRRAEEDQELLQQLIDEATSVR